MFGWLQSLLQEVQGDYLFVTAEGELCVIRETEEEPILGQLVVSPTGYIEFFISSNDGERTYHRVIVARITFLSSE